MIPPIIPMPVYTREEFKAEAAKHTSNWLIGEPKVIAVDQNGHTLEVAFHDPDCPYCAMLKWEAT